MAFNIIFNFGSLGEKKIAVQIRYSPLTAWS
jgi:hypothetical protein